MNLCEQSFSFICARRWEQLDRLPDAKVRYCGQCQRAVHKVETPEEYDAAQAAHHCIAWVKPAGGSKGQRARQAGGAQQLLGDVALDWHIK